MTWAKRTPVSTALAAAAAIVLAGCGGKHVSLADCLNSRGFLVQADANLVRGSTEQGVTFTLTVYRGPAAARRAFARNPADAALIGRAVVDFSNNPPPDPGGPPAKLPRRALAQIRACLTKP